MNPNDQPDYRRLFLAVFLAAVVLTAWQAFFEWPRRQQLAAYHAQQAKIESTKQVEYARKIEAVPVDTAENPNLSRDQRLALSRRLPISSGTLHGSLSLKGARFDDLTLARYRETLEPDSPEVILFSPSGDERSYLAQIGWVAGDGVTRVPDAASLWQADKPQIVPGAPVTLRWDNGAGVTFVITVTLDDSYMFSIEQRVENHSSSSIHVIPYGYINRAGSPDGNMQNMILHEGPMGVVEGALKEIPYGELKDKGNQSFEGSNGWLGITDKYWLAALVPTVSGPFKSTYSTYQKNSIDRFQVDYLADGELIDAGKSATSSTRLFAGAKEIDILDSYEAGKKGPPVPLFDRAVDFGMLYFLTKPLFLLLNFFYKLVGNFGVAIVLLTIVVKLCLFPLANAGYKSAAQMRRLQPEMGKLKEQHADDRINFQKELMALYKREKVNPASGCLPLLIQMPVFFALYKVLFVTIEMRHAPFFGWIKDLSAMDPSNVFTLFGLVPWAPPHFLHLGILPIVMCATMVIQMRQQPTPADPVQAKVIKFMPYMFLFMFASFPAGLVIYWICSNTLSIIQQHIITKKHGSAKSPK
ncbi:MAG: membrane protein insertase YidC [Alphaproteobacteria bacterium]|nr:membrane protein insertase YidC [Alphaproteobacteria bacterium]